ncbi:di-heme-cytochrome C peroxidase [Pseudomonas sp. NPDC089569]|uniref:di-heme-cytochrome C peroxidase n=1 Tax=Pseudomonas sp. NPDC089569 TaxID=3390722 RepID=UPI003D049712
MHLQLAVVSRSTVSALHTLISSQLTLLRSAAAYIRLWASGMWRWPVKRTGDVLLYRMNLLHAFKPELITMSSPIVHSAITICSLALAAFVIPVQAESGQGWSKQTLDDWRTLSQGSRFIPFSWAVALEKPSSTERFFTKDNIESYGYIPVTLRFQGKAFDMPLGFIPDVAVEKGLRLTKLHWYDGQDQSEPWLGLNCSACHTTHVTYQGKSMRVEGGPTNGDFQRIFEDLNKALQETARDRSKLERFSNAVLGANPSKKDAEMMSTALETLNTFYAQSAALNETTLRYGPGRLDAVGHILNKVSQINGAAVATPNPSDAPVSYPFLWNVPQHDKVQWNGIAGTDRLWAVRGNGLDIGALGRNTGEVIGVFADVWPVSNPGVLEGYKSSVKTKNLETMEHALESLNAPAWPFEVTESKPIQKPDGTVETGSSLYQKHCLACHALLPRTDRETPIKAVMIPIAKTETVDMLQPEKSTTSTDPWMACNAFQFTTDAGVLKGMKNVRGKGVIQSNDHVANMLAVTVKETLIGKKYDVAALAFNGFLGIETRPERVPGVGVLFTPQDAKDLRKYECYRESADILAYKARPLNGIWATAPFLHNGSVPTLYDLLLPPHERPKTFFTGTHEYNPERAGFRTEQRPDNTFQFDTTLNGNSNEGHDYGAGSLTSPERKLLLDYLKTL